MARNARSPLGPLALAFIAILLITLALWQTVAAGGGGSTGQAGQAGQATTYTVQRGDSLAAIAKKFGVNVEDLAEANDLWPGAFLYRNEVLTIPGAGTNGASATQENTADDAQGNSTSDMAASTSAITETAETEATGVDASAGITPTAENSPESTVAPTEETTEESAEAQSAPQTATAEPRAQQETYTVQRGDSLRQIARKLHVNVEELARANGLEVDSILYRRQVLIVPTQGTAAAEAAPEATATPQATEEATEEPTEEEATAEPTTEPTEEPTEEEAAAGVTETPTAEATEPAAEETPAPTAEATEEATAEPTIEATEEATAEPTIEATEEAAEEAIAEPTAEATAEPTATITATEEMTAAATLTATAEATDAVTETVTITPTTEITESVTAEPTAESTAEPAEEATAEPTAEPTEEPTAEAAAGDLIDTAEDAGNFTVLLSALEAAGLTDALKSEGPLTLFAPTDDAFAALPEGRLDELMADPEGELTQILLYHVVPGTLMADEIGDGQAALTLQGNELTFSVAGDQLQINDATVVTRNIETSNGVLHSVDALLIPPDLAGAPAAPDEATATLPTEGMTPEMTVADAAVIVITAPTQANGVPLVGATDVWQAVADDIHIITPVSGTVESRTAYHSPLAVSGLARAAVGSVQISLIGPDDTVLAERTLGIGPFGGEPLSETTTPDTYAFFAGYMRFYVNEPTEATLRVVEMDLGDGTILSESRVPIMLLGGQRVIDVTTPAVGQAVCDDIIVSGYSNTFEANVVVRLLTPDGSVQAEIPVMGGTLGVYRDFAATLPYPVDEPVALLVSAAESDASDRFDSIDQTQIPVTVYPPGAPDCTP